MTLINLTVLADALGTAAPIDAVLEAEATSARTAGAEARTPQKIVVPITAGAPTAPLNLEPTGIGWCWKLVLMVPATGYRITRFVQVPASGTVTWEDLVDVNPLTLKVLPDAVPAWKAAMDDLLAARDAAVLAVTDAGGVAVTAAATASTQAGLASGSAVAANQAEVAAGIARDESVAAKDLAISTVSDVTLTADTALTNAATAQATADAALPVHLPPATGTDLNTLTAVGVHPIPWLTGTLALNFPIASTAGIVETLPYDGVKLIQRFTPTTGTVATRGTWTRRRTDTSTWGAWTFQPVQRIDNTAGLAIYTWDETKNREQKVWEDTGWRILSSWGTDGIVTGDPLPVGIEPTPATKGYVKIKRKNGVVTLFIAGATVVASYARFPIPQGFGAYPQLQTQMYSGRSNIMRGVKISVSTFFTDLVVGDKFDPAYPTVISWDTQANTPTTLPGTSDGTIPHN